MLDAEQGRPWVDVQGYLVSIQVQQSRPAMKLSLVLKFGLTGRRVDSCRVATPAVQYCSHSPYCYTKASDHQS